MAYIEKRSRVTTAVVEELIARLESLKTIAIDGTMLSNMVRLCHACGLKKSELINLSVGDVAKGGVVAHVMRIGEDEIILSDPAKQLLQNHIDYLKKSGYRLYNTYPLFPTKKGRRYTTKTLGNHLKKAQSFEIESSFVSFVKPSKENNDITDTAINLEQIRQAGIRRHSEHLRDKGLSSAEALIQTAEFARVTKRETKGILTGNIQTTGKKTSPFLKYLEKIEMIAFSPNKSGKIQEDCDPEQIRSAIKKDPSLNDEEKSALESLLDDTIKEINKSLPLKDKPAKQPEHRSLLDAIKSLRDD